MYGYVWLAMSEVLVRTNMDRFVSLREMSKICGYSEMQILRLEKERVIPPRRYIGKRKTGWLQSEIEEWMRRRPLVR